MATLMPEVERGAKRLRSQSPAASASLQRHDVLWFGDGTIILCAESMCFRVHRDVLCLQSGVFKDMFSLPPDVAGNDTEDGCPVVRLHDKPHDVENMLLAIYHRRPYPPNKKPPLRFILSLLAMGTKYMIESLREEAKCVLRRAYPDSNYLRVPFCAPEFAEDYMHVVEDHLCSLYMDVMNTCETAGLWVVMPSLFYAFDYSIESVVRGARRADGTLSRLSPTSLERWLVGREKLRGAQKDDLLAGLSRGSSQCTQPVPCSAERLRLCLSLVTDDTLHVFGPWPNGWGKRKICAECLSSAKRSYTDAQERVWEQLPSMFGFPGWEELRKAAES